MNEIPPNIIHFFMLFVVISVRQWYEEVRHPPTTTAKISLITVRKGLTRQASETISHYLIQHQVLNPVLSKLIPSERTSRHGVASSCNVSVPEWISRPAGLKSMRELSKHPLVIDHVKLTNISPNVRVVLAWQWWLWTESLASTVSHYFHCVSYHPHFLKIDQTVDKCFVALVSKCHVFDQQGHERNDGRFQFGYC